MRRNLKIALAAIALGVAPVVAISPPVAAQSVGVTVSVPGIAFGYSDGYWDQQHHWHAWKSREQMDAWRQANAAHFYERRHDADAAAGWRANDQWWARH
jgi:hypothetical protein